MRFSDTIHDSQRIYQNIFGYSLTFPVVAPSDQHFYFLLARNIEITAISSARTMPTLCHSEEECEYHVIGIVPYSVIKQTCIMSFDCVAHPECTRHTEVVAVLYLYFTVWRVASRGH